MITIELPWPDKRLSPNSRCHWRAKAGTIQAARFDGYVLTIDTMEDTFKCQPLDRKNYSAQYIFYPPDRRKRDMDNCLAMMKPYQDGVCSAFGVDDSRIKRTVLEWGEVVKGGKVVLRLEEME